MFDDKSYTMYKDCELLLFGSDTESVIYNKPIVTSYDFLVYFRKFIDSFVINDYLSPLMKNNVLNYLNIVRFCEKIECDVDWRKKILLINEIILLVNSVKGDKYVTFYRKEMFKRTNNDDYMNLPGCFIVQSEDKLCYSISYDSLVLMSHSDKIDDISFQTDYLTQFISNWKYFESINCILNEYPDKFLDSLFMDRYQMVMSEFYKRDYGEPYNYGIVMFGDKVENKVKLLKLGKNV